MNAARHALAAGMVALGLCGPARAEAPAVAALLAPLKLTAYRAGTTPPPFSGKTAHSGAISLPALRGKVVLVNFWASWCAECRPEMPVLERLHRELGPKGLAVVGINAREDAAAVRRYAGEMRLSFPLVVDGAGTINKSYGIVAIPTTFLIARDGRAVAVGVGPRDWDGATARALLERLLAEPAARDGRS